ncbi:MAG TPA: phosphate ABC transporter permease PtsA [Candidatus Omnitrophica bacterium]|nr:MAG: phosphate ABC transporter, permease protein PstA [Omnitrophica WOR_2 bacterium GWA2_63_20]OGX30722.1 MAG: phosphate ABC transporter, permease protein PstA [Omnitrophica WOR_2 bacterium RIFCSPHIGHO2_12_FULL_64_13]OGX35019.1 MAG: phosphate ABC transporter, permease protein PstA [Omnitrophica WOR_2 bacterium RIFCSPHIGHO2_02_FULL_63_39]OGX44986.1 MAG: phosphate ABC transporter, permease protein PstA [Omnitrophica WOR_2 bacterium RIFCSPLOWO2_02_FULL_63_16]OGX49620.1 MAG: phosphate ABC transp
MPDRHPSKIVERLFKLMALGALVIALGTLTALLVDALLDGGGRLNWQFLTSFPSRKPEQAGIASALVGTIYLMILTAACALPIGVGAALYLEEYVGKHWLARVIEVNIANLAGVPSIIYGLLGLELFVRMMGLGRSLLAGALTMALLVLPIVIIATREALRTVPSSIREASYALGASRWQTIWHQVLPLALPGILTGSILALSRAIGEAAPLITMGALTYIAFLPDSLLAPFTALPIQIFNWVSRPQPGFHANAAAGIVVLLAVLLIMNGLAVYVRQRAQKRLYL